VVHRHHQCRAFGTGIDQFVVGTAAEMRASNIGIGHRRSRITGDDHNGHRGDKDADSYSSHAPKR